MDDPLTLVTRLYDEVFNGGDLTKLDELVSPEFREHQFAPPGQPAPAVGHRSIRGVLGALRAASPDIRWEIEDSAVSGDTVWIRVRATGTDTGGHLGFPATGRPFAITVMDVLRAEDGKLVEHWGVPDRLSLLQQLGHVPPLPAPAPPVEAAAVS